MFFFTGSEAGVYYAMSAANGKCIVFSVGRRSCEQKKTVDIAVQEKSVVGQVPPGSPQQQ